jgi:hypothetical protein
MIRRRILRIAGLGALLLGHIAVVTGCVHKGPAQRAGEKFDRAMDDLKDTVDPPGPAQKAGRAIDRTVDNVTK